MANETPFSFHCMICFEEFTAHPEGPYPVVLPCGHTYVCNCCADRLDKCMECRTPLYTTLPNNNKNKGPPHNVTNRSGGWSNSRSGAHAYPAQHPPQPPIKKRLPLPKNVVLLSLIEATEMATESVNRKQHFDNSPKNSQEYSPVPVSPTKAIIDFTNEAENNEDESEEGEEEKIRFGATLANSVAGTYAVAAQEGLEIYQTDPLSRKERTELNASNAISDNDVDTLVQFFNSDQQRHVNNKDRQENHDDNPCNSAPTTPIPCRPEVSCTGSNSPRDRIRLNFGDRVQIVGVDGNWAKLARGYGYVKVSKNSLVKVGNSLDRACKLEGMLRNLSQRRKQLRMEQSKVDNKFIRLMNDLQLSLHNDEDMTVICADTFSAVDGDKNNIGELSGRATSVSVSHSSSVRLNMPNMPIPEERNENDETCSVLKPAPMERQVTPPRLTDHGSRLVCFANDVFGGPADTMETGRMLYESVSQPIVHSMGSSDNVDSNSVVSFSQNYTPVMFSTLSQPSPSEMRAGARAWRERNGRAPSSGGADLRTGRSGHMALLSSHAYSHEYLDGAARTPTRGITGTSSASNTPLATGNGTPLRMSSHTGLSRPKINYGDIWNRLTLRMNVSREDEASVPRTGSM